MKVWEITTSARVGGHNILGCGLLAVAMKGRLLSAAAFSFDSFDQNPLKQNRRLKIPSAAQTQSPPAERPQQFFGTTEVIVDRWCSMSGLEVT